MTESELRVQNFPFPAKTLVRAIEMDDKTRIARKIPDIPPGEIVEVKELYSNFFGTFAQVEWAGYPGHTYSLKPDVVTLLPPGTVVPTKKDKETKDKLSELSKSLSLIAEALLEYDPTKNVSEEREKEAYRLIALVLLSDRIWNFSKMGVSLVYNPEYLSKVLDLWLHPNPARPINSSEGEIRVEIGKIASKMVDEFMPQIKQEFCK